MMGMGDSATTHPEPQGSEPEQGGTDLDPVSILDNAMESSIKSAWVNVKDPKHLGPPINATVADTLDSWIAICPKKEQISPLFEICKIPANCECLMPININSFLWQRLPSRVKQADKKVMTANSFVRRSLGTLAPIWHILQENTTIDSLLADEKQQNLSKNTSRQCTTQNHFGSTGTRYTLAIVSFGTSIFKKEILSEALPRQEISLLAIRE